MDVVLGNTRSLRAIFTKRRLWKLSSTKTFKTVAPESVSGVTAAEIKIKLKQQNITYTDGYTYYHVNECNLCYPLVKRTSPAKSTDIYINKTTGYFVCDNCKLSGNWNILYRLLCEKQKEERSAKDIAALKDGTVKYSRVSEKWKDVVAHSKLLSTLEEYEISSVFKQFNLPQCSQPVLEKLQVYINESRSILYFPITSLNQSIVGYKSLDNLGVGNTVPRSDCSGFITLPCKKKQVPTILVSSIEDLLTLASQDISANLICLPYGIANLPQSALPCLESHEKIILWLGCSVGAWNSAINFAKKLGEKRCYLIPPTDSQCSATVALSKGENLQKIISEAHPTWHRAITTFSSLRQDVLSELQNNEQVLGVKWTRYPALNKILKGHRRGELTIVTGPTGSGKTTFMSEYSLDLAMQGVNTLWGSFEIRNVRLARTMLQQFAGIPLEENLQEFDIHADSFEKLPIYFMTFHGQQSIRAVMEAVEYSSYIYDIGHVIIDNVQFMIGVADEAKYVDRFWKQDLVIQSFRSFASKNNCHVTLVIHPRKEREAEDLTTNSIFGGAKAAQEADNILIIQDKRLTSIRGKKYLQVCKNRYTGDLGIMLLEFDKSSLSYAAKKKTSAGKSDPADPT